MLALLRTDGTSYVFMVSVLSGLNFIQEQEEEQEHGTKSLVKKQFMKQGLT